MSTSKSAKILGKRGGLVRAKRLSSKRKRQIASLGASARAESIRMAKRIEANFRYLNAVFELAPPPKVHSLKTADKKLAGLYA